MDVTAHHPVKLFFFGLSDQCVLEDLDADGICDELDLLDLSGADAQSVRIRATRPDATRRDGLVRVKMDLDLDEQSFYLNASEFLAAGETNGFSLALYRGQEDPSADDVAVVSLSVDPADCSFGGSVGDLRRVSCRTVPAEPGGTFTKLKMKLGSQLSVLAVVRRADVSAPEGGPIHVVLNARDAEQVDFAGRLDQCVLRGSKRPTLGCR